MVAKNLKELRRSAGMSRRQLAETTGIAWRSVEGHEQGRPMNLVAFTAYKRALPGLEEVTCG